MTGRSVHLIGIAGSGMSALARWFRNQGWQVSGCDRTPGETGLLLEEEGITVISGHSPSHLDGADLVIWTAALHPDHPELKRAREMGIRLLRRSEALAELTDGTRLIAVGGAHGKTTTTTMIGWILEKTGHDPTVFVGGHVDAWNGNYLAGGNLTVVEADEYDRAFLRLKPYIAVVTSYALEHLECYGSEEALAEAYGVFLELSLPGGGVVVPFGHRSLARWAERIGRRIVTTGSGGDVWCEPLGGDGWGELYSVCGVEGRLPEPGIHNLENASAAIAACEMLGVQHSDSVRALSSFPGVSRRLELLGKRDGTLIISDYAHHPDEVASALNAVSRMTDGKVAAVFQPHLFSRTSAMYREMGKALLGCSKSFVLPIYPAREEPIPGVSSGLVAESAREAGGDSVCIDSAELEDALERILDEVSVVLFMGAGTIDGLARIFAGRGGNATS